VVFSSPCEQNNKTPEDVAAPGPSIPCEENEETPEDVVAPGPSISDSIQKDEDSASSPPAGQQEQGRAVRWLRTRLARFVKRKWGLFLTSIQDSNSVQDSSSEADTLSSVQDCFESDAWTSFTESDASSDSAAGTVPPMGGARTSVQDSSSEADTLSSVQDSCFESDVWTSFTESDASSDSESDASSDARTSVQDSSSEADEWLWFFAWWAV